MFELGFNGEASRLVGELQDNLFVNKIEQETHQRSDGHFEMLLPFKDDNNQFPDKEQASSRLEKLR